MMSSRRKTTVRHEKEQREAHQTKDSSDSMKTRCSNTVTKGGSETLKVRRNPTTRNPGLEEREESGFKTRRDKRRIAEGYGVKADLTRTIQPIFKNSFDTLLRQL